MTNLPRINSSILNRIGNTPLIELRNIVPKGCARILLKIESEDPTASMKDRMALAMIEAVEADGRLQPNGHVIVYTGGSAGVSLSMICAVKGYTSCIITSDAFSIEKQVLCETLYRYQYLTLHCACRQSHHQLGSNKQNSDPVKKVLTW